MEVFAQRPDLMTPRWYRIDTRDEASFDGVHFRSLLEQCQDSEYTCCRCGAEAYSVLEDGEYSGDEHRRLGRVFCEPCEREARDEDEQFLRAQLHADATAEEYGNDRENEGGLR